jgi:hypothetical protein
MTVVAMSIHGHVGAADLIIFGVLGRYAGRQEVRRQRCDRPACDVEDIRASCWELAWARDAWRDQVDGAIGEGSGLKHTGATKRSA